MSENPLRDLLESCDLEPYAYSGRGMYGEKCLAVNADSLGQVLSVIVRECPDDARDEVADALHDVRWDSMGRDQIVVYFPSVNL